MPRTSHVFSNTQLLTRGVQYAHAGITDECVHGKYRNVPQALAHTISRGGGGRGEGLLEGSTTLPAACFCVTRTAH